MFALDAAVIVDPAPPPPPPPPMEKDEEEADRVLVRAAEEEEPDVEFGDRLFPVLKVEELVLSPASEKGGPGARVASFTTCCSSSSSSLPEPEPELLTLRGCWFGCDDCEDCDVCD